MIQIRKANFFDITELKTMFTETVKSVCSNDYTAVQIQAWLKVALNNQRWLDMLENQQVILVLNDNIIIGFASLDSSNYIDMFFVHSQYQKLGVATLLYGEIEKIAKMQFPLTIWANVSLTAMPFFKKNGFSIDKEQEVNCQGIILNNFKVSKKLI